MGTYIIIGGDGREYGPITQEDVRQWIAEGRLNAQSLAKSVSDAEFRPLEKFPEFADVCGGNAPGTIAPSSSMVSDEDYELDLGGCISRGWELVKKNFGTLFVCVLVFFGIQIALNSMVNFTVMSVLNKVFSSAAASVGLGFLFIGIDALVIGPLLGGIFLVYLKTIRGVPTGVGEVFGGFQKAYGQLVLGSLAVNLIIGLCMAPFSYVTAEKVNPLLHKLQAMQTQSAASADMGNLMGQMLSAYASALPVLLICLVPVTYLTVSWQFTLVLVIDKGLNFSAAMKTSWKRVNRHWWVVFGLTILVGLVSVSGVLGCGIGVLCTIPIGFAALMFAYETIFNAKKD
jgi:uncharacterized membrane protein